MVGGVDKHDIKSNERLKAMGCESLLRCLLGHYAVADTAYSNPEIKNFKSTFDVSPDLRSVGTSHTLRLRISASPLAMYLLSTKSFKRYSPPSPLSSSPSPCH